MLTLTKLCPIWNSCSWPILVPGWLYCLGLGLCSCRWHLACRLTFCESRLSALRCAQVCLCSQHLYYCESDQFCFLDRLWTHEAGQDACCRARGISSSYVISENLVQDHSILVILKLFIPACLRGGVRIFIRKQKFVGDLFVRQQSTCCRWAHMLAACCYCQRDICYSCSTCF